MCGAPLALGAGAVRFRLWRSVSWTPGAEGAPRLLGVVVVVEAVGTMRRDWEVLVGGCWVGLMRDVYHGGWFGWLVSSRVLAWYVVLMGVVALLSEVVGSKTERIWEMCCCGTVDGDVFVLRAVCTYARCSWRPGSLDDERGLGG